VCDVMRADLLTAVVSCQKQCLNQILRRLQTS
jgi:hypothetical protein